MHFCSYCGYHAPTNSSWKRHLNTQKHDHNFMLVDAGVQDLVEPPAFDNDNNSHDIPNHDNFCIPPDLTSISIPDSVTTPGQQSLTSIDSVTTCSSDIQDIIWSDDDWDNDDDSRYDDLPALIDLSTNFEFKYDPIDKDVAEMSNASFGIISSVSRFFTDHPIALRFVQIAGLFGLLWFKPQPAKSSLAESC